MKIRDKGGRHDATRVCCFWSQGTIVYCAVVVASQTKQLLFSGSFTSCKSHSQKFRLVTRALSCWLGEFV